MCGAELTLQLNLLSEACGELLYSEALQIRRTFPGGNLPIIKVW